jgi:hypothetical protein
MMALHEVLMKGVCSLLEIQLHPLALQIFLDTQQLRGWEDQAQTKAIRTVQVSGGGLPTETEPMISHACACFTEPMISHACACFE